MNGELKFGKEPVEALHPRPEGLLGTASTPERVIPRKGVAEVRRSPVKQRRQAAIRQVLEGGSGNSLNDCMVHGPDKQVRSTFSQRHRGDSSPPRSGGSLSVFPHFLTQCQRIRL